MRNGRRLKTLTVICNHCKGTGTEPIGDYERWEGYEEEDCYVCLSIGHVEVLPRAGYRLIEYYDHLEGMAM